MLLAKVNSTYPWKLLLPNPSSLTHGILFFRTFRYTIPVHIWLPPDPLFFLEDFIMAKNKHLTLHDRNNIELELSKGSSFKAIAALLGKDCTTISKEVRLHRSFEMSGALGKAFNDCFLSFSRQCSLIHVCKNCLSRSRKLCWSCGKCISHCPSYQKYSCPKLDKPPYVCNPCPSRKNCTLEKAVYRAASAQRAYESLRSDARSGFAISETELQKLDSVVSPYLKNGQSLHHIAITHKDEIMKSERTLYNYVNSGLFSARNLDMPRTVRMRPRKNKASALKVDKACRIGRSYDDFLTFMAQHPELPARQLDSVEGIQGGAVLLTIHFVEQQLQLAFLRSRNDSQSVIDIFERLYLELRPDIFMDIFPVLLADNGSEFSNPRALEFDGQGNQRSRMFYCNPNAPYQKPNCENNHEMIRRCIPKGVDIGQYTQQQISLMMSHINSYARQSLGNKTPYDVFAFQYGETVLNVFGLKRIPADEIILTPGLFDTF